MSRSDRAFSLAIAERRALLLFGDVVAVNGALAAVLQFAPRPEWLDAVAREGLGLLQWYAVLTMLWLFCAAVTDSYDPAVAGSRFASPYRVACVTLLVFVVYSFVPFLTPPALKSRLVWTAATGAAIVAVSIWRVAYAVGTGHALLAHRVLIVGAGEAGRLVAEAMAAVGPAAYRVLGFIDDSTEDAGRWAGEVPILGTSMDLHQAIQDTAATEIVVAVNGPLPAEAYRGIAEAYEAGIRVSTMVQVYEGLTGRIPVEHIGDHWLTVLPQETSARTSYAVFKRTVDIAGGLVGLLATAVLFVPISLAIWLDSGRPILFSQARLGLRGRTIRIDKFRTVRPRTDSEAALSIWERKNVAPTRVGRLLRKARLDELPQFWSVLRGDMSLVGPRPFVPEEVQELEKEIPFFRSRLLVRPGLTGWAQVRAGYGTSIDDELEKLQYDLYYVRHQSLALDLIILIKTVAVVLRLAGR